MDSIATFEIFGELLLKPRKAVIFSPMPAKYNNEHAATSQNAGQRPTSCSRSGLSPQGPEPSIAGLLHQILPLVVSLPCAPLLNKMMNKICF
jgi:hypothetical protein